MAIIKGPTLEPTGPIDPDKFRASALNFRLKQGISEIDEKGKEVKLVKIDRYGNKVKIGQGSKGT